jgi:hypothetical protein
MSKEQELEDEIEVLDIEDYESPGEELEELLNGGFSELRKKEVKGPKKKTKK